jgi:hypothetical protein
MTAMTSIASRRAMEDGLLLPACCLELSDLLKDGASGALLRASMGLECRGRRLKNAGLIRRPTPPRELVKYTSCAIALARIDPGQKIEWRLQPRGDCLRSATGRRACVAEPAVPGHRHATAFRSCPAHRRLWRRSVGYRVLGPFPSAGQAGSTGRSFASRIIAAGSIGRSSRTIRSGALLAGSHSRAPRFMFV